MVNRESLRLDFFAASLEKVADFTQRHIRSKDAKKS